MTNRFFMFLVSILLFTSCVNDDATEFFTEFLPIEEFIVPATFDAEEENDITIKYIFPTNCYSLESIYYEYDGTSRIIAIRALVQDLNNCEDTNQTYEYTFPITANQSEDYILKFWKGEDANGVDIYEEVIVPVI